MEGAKIYAENAIRKKNEKKTTDQYAEQKSWVFSFDLKEESEDECLTERGSEFQSTGPMYRKDRKDHSDERPHR